jgi:protein SCO1/2
MAAVTLAAAILVPALAGCEGGAPRFNSTDISGVNYGRDFALADLDGNIRRLADFRGKAVLVFFGFIRCPDVCPTALLRAAEVKRLLGGDGERFQVIFITLDPERDLPPIIREYIAMFDPDFIGLRATPEQTREVADAFRIYYRKVPTGASYTVDHSATSYLYDPQGRLRLAVAHTASAEAVAADVRALLHGDQRAED